MHWNFPINNSPHQSNQYRQLRIRVVNLNLSMIVCVIFLYGINDSSHNLWVFFQKTIYTKPGHKMQSLVCWRLHSHPGRGVTIATCHTFSVLSLHLNGRTAPSIFSGVVIAMQLGVVSIFEALVAPASRNEMSPAPGFCMSPLWLRRIYGIPCMCLSHSMSFPPF